MRRIESRHKKNLHNHIVVLSGNKRGLFLSFAVISIYAAFYDHINFKEIFISDKIVPYSINFSTNFDISTFFSSQ